MPPSDPLDIDLVPDRERLLVAPAGEIDVHTVSTLRGALADAVEAGWSEVVADLRSVTFMGAEGVHALLDARSALLAAGGRLTLVDGNPAVGRALDVLGLRATFETARSPEAG